MPRPQRVFTPPPPPISRRKGGALTNRYANVVLFLSVTMILVGVLLYLWPQVRLVTLGYRQNELRTQRTQALQRQKELHVELGTLRQLPRIEAIATQNLGLRIPPPSHVIYVRPEQQVPGPRRD